MSCSTPEHKSLYVFCYLKKNNNKIMVYIVGHN